jgi:hypothetical protein
MQRRLLLAMSTVEKCQCHKALQGNISIGFSLSIRFGFYFFKSMLFCLTDKYV